MKKEYIKIPIGDLIPYENNPRLNEKAIPYVSESIKQVGYITPIIVDENNVILAGHTRLKGLLSQNWVGDLDVLRVSGLTEEEKKKFRILDNKTGEFAEWDFDKLAEELDGLDFGDFDFGFDFEEEEVPEIEDIVEDTPPEPPEIPLSQIGDLWVMGQHRLICGDSTSMEVLNRLLDGVEIDCVVTDPPYNMGYEGAGGEKNRSSKRIKNDKMPEEQFEKFLHDIYVNYYMSMKNGASIYVFYKELGSGVFIRQMKEGGLTFKQELVWVKNKFVLGGSKYQNMYEPCLMGCKGEQIKKWNGGRSQASVIESIDLMDEEDLREAVKEWLGEKDDIDVIRERKPLKNDLHPTMKPIRLLAKLIRNSTDIGDTVLDLFGGSGSTMIASEQLKRRCFMCELDEKFVDVIVKRYVNLTGDAKGTYLIRDGSRISYSDVFAE